MFEVIVDDRRYIPFDDCRIPAEPDWSLQDCKAPSFPQTAYKPKGTLQPHPALRIVPLEAGYWVAYVPSFSRVAVINDATRQLLIEPRQDDSPNGEATGTIELLAQLGLFIDGLADAPKPAESEVLTAWVHVTNACNLRCHYCYINKTHEAMSEQTGRAAIDATIRSARANGYKHIALKYAGGEATLNIPLIAHLQHYAIAQAQRFNLSLQAGVLSNGTTLSRRSIRLLQELGLRLMISLDGLDDISADQRVTVAGKPSSQLAIRGIETALALGLVPDISVTITETSVGGLPALVDWLLDHDLPFTLNFYRQHSAQIEETNTLQADEQRLIDGLRAAYAVIAQRPPRWNLLGALLDRSDLSVSHTRACAAGHDYLVIDQRGQIATCQMEIERPVTTVAAADPLAVIRQDQIGVQTRSVDTKADCHSCEWRYWCAGGCPVATFRATGRYDSRSPNCRIYRTLYPELILLEGRRLLHHHAMSSLTAS